ncbi:MAG: carbon starvation CstA 5TM domain-containing protein, partial [Pseudomonadota bacterium]
YILEELLSLNGRRALWFSTAATLILPLLFGLTTFRDSAGQPVPVWKVVWPVFGATNQLLGALALTVITVWLKRSKKPFWVTLFPLLFMASATMLSLLQLAVKYGLSLIGVVAVVLFVLAAILLLEALRSMLVTK